VTAVHEAFYQSCPLGLWFFCGHVREIAAYAPAVVKDFCALFGNELFYGTKDIGVHVFALP
jgi:hypothetical protein